MTLSTEAPGLGPREVSEANGGLGIPAEPNAWAPNFARMLILAQHRHRRTSSLPPATPA
jgi:hypothetical protein